MEVAAFFEHPAYDMAFFRDRFFAYRANSYRGGGIAIAVWTAEYLGQSIAFGGIDDSFDRFALFERRSAERAGSGTFYGI